MTFGKHKSMRVINTKFLVVNCKFMYMCIIRCQTLAQFVVVSLMVHLKMKISHG